MWSFLFVQLSSVLAFTRWQLWLKTKVNNGWFHITASVKTESTLAVLKSHLDCSMCKCCTCGKEKVYCIWSISSHCSLSWSSFRRDPGTSFLLRPTFKSHSVNSRLPGFDISAWKTTVRHTQQILAGRPLYESCGWQTCWVWSLCVDTQDCTYPTPPHPTRHFTPKTPALHTTATITSELPWEPVRPKQGHRADSQLMMSLTLQSITLINCIWSWEEEKKRKRCFVLVCN